jgi:Flp pilus assembly pilin Flp
MLTTFTRVRPALSRLRQRACSFWLRSDGATATEYALIAAAVAVAIIAAIFAVGNTLSDFFNGIGDNITSTSG